MSCLSIEAVRQIVIQLVADEQDILIAHGATTIGKSLRRLAVDLKIDEIDALTIDEDDLGFDSLSRLDLVSRLNTFFGLHMSGVEDYMLVNRGLGDWISLIGRHLEICGNDTEISFLTSGSSGTPKVVKHTLGDMMVEVVALCQSEPFQVRNFQRIVALVPPHHIYGFIWTCLLPSYLTCQHISVQHAPPSRVFSVAKPGDLIIATPFVWNHLAQLDRAFASDVHGITSAAPSDTTTWSHVQTGSLGSLTEIYGATETGGIALRQSLGSPFQLLPHLVRRETGLIHKTPMRIPLQVQDKLQWINASEFHIAGRVDELCQVGGVNVSPSHVVKQIERLGEVSAAHVRLEKQRLKAFVVPSDPTIDSGAFLALLHSHLTKMLPAVARPASITVGATLPRNKFGKLSDW